MINTLLIFKHGYLLQTLNPKGVLGFDRANEITYRWLISMGLGVSHAEFYLNPKDPEDLENETPLEVKPALVAFKRAYMGVQMQLLETFGTTDLSGIARSYPEESLPPKKIDLPNTIDF